MTLLAALAGALAISFSAIFFGLSGVDPLTGAFFRVAYALPVLVVIWLTVRQRDQRTWQKRLLAFGSGFLLAVDMVAWHNAIGHIGAGLATLIANSQVVFVAIAAWLILGERPSRRIVIAIPVVLIGVAMVSGLGRGDAFGSNPLLGTLLALVSAMFYAGFILVFRASNNIQAPPAGPLMEATAGGVVTMLFFGAVTGGIDFTPTWPAHGWLIALAFGAQVGGWLLIGFALPRLPAVETATIILVQPVLTMIWASIIFDERPSPIQLTGAALVLAGVGFVAIARARVAPEPTPTTV
ncbi:MAG TPA: DMT family transporter [Acidimicrobiia bacterium]|nr:DMT family transporter [Acidimicrobiia bacterium]